MQKDNWRIEHGRVIDDFLKYLNRNSSNYILKGGTALKQCYNLPRFSEDIDLDSLDRNSIRKIVKDFCKKNNYTFRAAKDTPTTQRYFVHYSDKYNSKPLKIEISFRRRKINPDEIKTINGLEVYSINALCLMKSGAYQSRDKIRDLFDLSFIINEYYDQLNDSSLFTAEQALEYKGLEQFDYITATQKDDLIDNDKLEESFLSAMDKLNVLDDYEPAEVQNNEQAKQKQDYDDFER